MSTIVEVKRLVKSYGKVRAVGEISFALEANKSFVIAIVHRRFGRAGVYVFLIGLSVLFTIVSFL